MRNDKRSETIRADRADPLYVAVGSVLRNMRLTQDLTQRQISDGLGVDNASIVYYEKGRNRVPLALFVKWCELLRINPGEVLEAAKHQAVSARLPRQRKEG